MALPLRGVDSLGCHHGHSGHSEGSRWTVRDTFLVVGGAIGENGMLGDDNLGGGEEKKGREGCSCTGRSIESPERLGYRCVEKKKSDSIVGGQCGRLPYNDQKY